MKRRTQFNKLTLDTSSKEFNVSTKEKRYETTIDQTASPFHKEDIFPSTEQREQSTVREKTLEMAKVIQNRRTQQNQAKINEKQSLTKEALRRIEERKKEKKKINDLLRQKRRLRSKISALIKQDNFFLCDCFCGHNVLV